ncbi:MAG: endonuclease III, partial [Erysipelotrichales bacterium]|nr:endonuclease III [Erysipelotrichales bacterium]
MKRKSDEILDRLEILFPNAGCELHFRNEFELLCAVILSAQTTDVSVNKVTPALFERYPDAASMALADPKELEPYIRSIGLYRNKAQSLFGMANALVKNHGGSVPSSFEKLTALPGVGRKTANVVSAEGFGIPALAVDTHV